MNAHIGHVQNEGDIFRIKIEYTDDGNLRRSDATQSTPIISRRLGNFVIYGALFAACYTGTETGAFAVTGTTPPAYAYSAPLQTVIPTQASVKDRLGYVDNERRANSTESMPHVRAYTNEKSFSWEAVETVLPKGMDKVRSDLLPTAYKVAIGGNILASVVSGVSLLSTNLVPHDIAAILFPICSVSAVSFALDWAVRGRH